MILNNEVDWKLGTELSYTIEQDKKKVSIIISYRGNKRHTLTTQIFCWAVARDKTRTHSKTGDSKSATKKGISGDETQRRSEVHDR